MREKAYSWSQLYGRFKEIAPLKSWTFQIYKLFINSNCRKVNIINIVRCSLRHITTASVCRISKQWDKKQALHLYTISYMVRYYDTQNYCIRPPPLLFVLSYNFQPTELGLNVIKVQSAALHFF